MAAASLSYSRLTLFHPPPAPARPFRSPASLPHQEQQLVSVSSPIPRFHALPPLPSVVSLLPPRCSSTGAAPSCRPTVSHYPRAGQHLQPPPLLVRADAALTGEIRGFSWFFTRRAEVGWLVSDLGIGLVPLWCGDEYEAGGAHLPPARARHHVAVRVEAADRGGRGGRPRRRPPPAAAARPGGRRQGKDHTVSREKYSTA